MGFDVCFKKKIDIMVILNFDFRFLEKLNIILMHCTTKGGNFEKITLYVLYIKPRLILTHRNHIV